MNLPEKKNFSVTQMKIFDAGKTDKLNSFSEPVKLLFEMNKLFVNISSDLKIKEEVDKTELARIVKYLITYFPSLSIGDIQIAFEFFCVGKLDKYFMRNGKQVQPPEHYGKLSIEFICKIINAYKLCKENERVPVDINRQLTSDSEVLKAQKAKHEFLLHFIDCYEGRQTFLFSHFEYSYMVKLGIVDSDLTLTEEEMIDAKEKYPLMSNKKSIHEIRAVLSNFMENDTLRSFAEKQKIKKRMLEAMSEKHEIKKLINKLEGTNYE